MKAKYPVKSYVHPDLGTQTLVLVEHEVYFVARDLVTCFGHRAYGHILEKIGGNPKPLMVPRKGCNRLVKAVNYATAVEMVAYLSRSLNRTEIYRRWYGEMMKDFLQGVFKQNLKAELLKCIKRHDSNGGATFGVLEQNFARHGYSYKGSGYLFIDVGVKGGRCLVRGWNREAFGALEALLKEGSIVPEIGAKEPYHDITGLAAAARQAIKKSQPSGWPWLYFKVTSRAKMAMEAA